MIKRRSLSRGGRIALLALIVAAAVLTLRNREFFEPSYETIYDEYRSILSQAHELSARNADDDAWEAFERESHQRLEPICRELLALCERHPTARRTAFGRSAEDDYVTSLIRRPLYQLGQYQIPRLIKEGRSGKSVEAMSPYLERTLGQVRKALDADRGGSLVDAQPQ